MAKSVTYTLKIQIYKHANAYLYPPLDDQEGEGKKGNAVERIHALTLNSFDQKKYLVC